MNVLTIQERLEFRARQEAKIEAERLFNALPYFYGKIIEFYHEKTNSTIAVGIDYVLTPIKLATIDVLYEKFLDQFTKELLAVMGGEDKS